MDLAAVQALFAPFGIDQVGVADYEALLPLLPTRSRGRLPENPRRVIACLFPYYIGEYPRRNLSRYAILPDYHTLCGGILSQVAQKLSVAFPQNAFVPFVDASPIREVAAGVAAGLGVLGKNGQLINPTYGSYTFIGTIVTNLEGVWPFSTPLAGGCLSCGQCFAACPTGALGRAGFAKEICLSHLTQKKGALSPREQALIQKGGMAWGCDRCTDCCPHNANPKASPIKAFYTAPLPMLDGTNVEAALENRAFAYRGKGVLERNLTLLNG